MSSILNRELKRTIKNKLGNLGYKSIGYLFQRDETSFEETFFSTLTFSYASYQKKGCILVTIRVGVSFPEIEIIKYYLINEPLFCDWTYQESLCDYLGKSYFDYEYEFSLDNLESAVEQMVNELPPIITSFINTYHTIDTVYEAINTKGLIIHRQIITPIVLYLRGQGSQGLAYLESQDTDYILGRDKNEVIKRYKDLITGKVKIDLEAETIKWRKKLSR